MPDEPSEIKWNDVVRMAAVSCATFVAAFAPLREIFPYIDGLYLSNKGTKPLGPVSIVANMSLAICLLGIASGLFAFFLVAIFSLDRWMKIWFSLMLVAFAVICFFDHEATSILAGSACLIYVALSWTPKPRYYVKDHGKQVIIIVWVTAAVGILAFYKYLDIGPMAAYPLSQFGPNRLQFTLFGVEGYLFLFFWVSLKIFKKNLLGRDKDDPVLYVSPACYAWVSVYLPLMGIAFYFIFALVVTGIMGKMGFSDWTTLKFFLIGHAFAVSGVLLKLFVILANRKQSATGSFMSRVLSSHYSSYGGCCGPMSCNPSRR
ncbi:MAG: hypothetical protein ABSD98_01865 [Candidatus Korobacteraceae bacterium]|jgi:hypothetical protein